jgi:hypothetical protein
MFRQLHVYGLWLYYHPAHAQSQNNCHKSKDFGQKTQHNLQQPMLLACENLPLMRPRQ